MNIINTRADIEALPDTEKAIWLTRLAASIYRRDAGGNTVTDTTTIERFGYTLEDFPEAPIAEYIAPIVPEPKHPAIVALEDAEKHGIEVPFGVGTVMMACGDRDRALFSSALALYRTAEDLLPDEAAKAAFRDSPVTFADAGGTPHTLTVTQARMLLVAYGATYQSIWAAAAQAS